MLRRALPTCLAFTALVTACGGKASPPKIPQVSIPGPTAWDGKGPADNTVVLLSTLPGDDSKFVAYEFNTGTCTVDRTIVDDIDKLGKFVVTTLTDPHNNAGTLLVGGNPPPPPPNGGDIGARALGYAQPGNPGPSCGAAPIKTTFSATHQ